MASRILALAGVLLAAATCLAQGSAPGTMTMPAERKPANPSTSLAVTVAGKTTSYSLADLQAMPQRTVVAHNGHSNVDESYTGVAVSDLLGKFGITLLNGGAKKVYDSYLRAEGTDRYFVLYSVSEVEGAMHAGDVIVALTLDGKPLMEDGSFKLVSSEDKRPARWVRNLTSLTLVTVE